MAPWRTRPFLRPFTRTVVAGFASTVALTALGGSALAEDERFTIAGTVYEVRGDLLTIITDDLIGRSQPITVDVSQIRGLQITPNTPIQLTIVAREDDSYLATGIVRESPYVNGLEFGVREEFTTRQDSIQAGVGNVPEDDEALNQQHRTNDLRHREDDDDDDDEKHRR